MSTLKPWLAKFQAANPGNQVKIINDAAAYIERNSLEGIELDKDAMIDVKVQGLKGATCTSCLQGVAQVQWVAS